MDAGLQAQWLAVLQQGLPVEMLAMLASMILALMLVCAFVARLRYHLPLQPLSIGATIAQKDLMPEHQPHLSLMLCPYSTLV
jgi:hypothetical protein